MPPWIRPCLPSTQVTAAVIFCFTLFVFCRAPAAVHHIATVEQSDPDLFLTSKPIPATYVSARVRSLCLHVRCGSCDVAKRPCLLATTCRNARSEGAHRNSRRINFPNYYYCRVVERIKRDSDKLMIFRRPVRRK